MVVFFWACLVAALADVSLGEDPVDALRRAASQQATTSDDVEVQYGEDFLKDGQCYVRGRPKCYYVEAVAEDFFDQCTYDRTEDASSVACEDYRLDDDFPENCKTCLGDYGRCVDDAVYGPCRTECYAGGDITTSSKGDASPSCLACINANCSALREPCDVDEHIPVSGRCKRGILSVEDFNFIANYTWAAFPEADVLSKVFYVASKLNSAEVQVPAGHYTAPQMDDLSILDSLRLVAVGGDAVITCTSDRQGLPSIWFSSWFIFELSGFVFQNCSTTPIQITHISGDVTNISIVLSRVTVVDCSKEAVSLSSYLLGVSRTWANAVVHMVNCSFRNTGGVELFIEDSMYVADNVRLLVEGSEFLNNQGGGALRARATDVRIHNCLFANNTFDDGGAFGGALSLQCNRVYDYREFKDWTNYKYNSTVHISDSKFINNSADSGGAIALTNGYISVENSHFHDNWAVKMGGAICLACDPLQRGDSGFRCRDSMFSNNSVDSSSGWAGATFFTDAWGALEIQRCKFDLVGGPGSVTDFYSASSGNIQVDNESSFGCLSGRAMDRPADTVRWSIGKTAAAAPAAARMSMTCRTCPAGEFTPKKSELWGPVAEKPFVHRAMWWEDKEEQEEGEEEQQQRQQHRQHELANIAEVTGCQKCSDDEFIWDTEEQKVCHKCPAGKTLTVQPALGPEACEVDIIYVLVCFIMFLLLSALVSVLWFTIRPVSIDDIHESSDGIVITTARSHCILKLPLVKPKVRFSGSGVLTLDKSTKAIMIKAIDHSRLMLIVDSDFGEGLPLESSMGSLRVELSKAVFCTGLLRVPTVALVSILSSATIGLEVAKGIAVEHVALIVAVALCLALLLCYLSAKPTTIASKIGMFRSEILKTPPWLSFRSSGPPERAISAGQLHHFLDFFQSFLHNRNMYYCVSNLVIPITQKEQLAFSEFVGAGMVDFFVSHFWGGAFREFAETISAHARTWAGSGPGPGAKSWRDLRYWICSFSNNQWQLKKEMPGDIYCSSFYLALRSPTCRGTVMVLDQEAKPLTRVWCLFELLQTFDLEDSNPDFFSGINFGTPAGLLNSGVVGFDTVMALGRRLTQLKLEDAEAACDDDKNKIFKAVREGGGFEHMNKVIRMKIRDALKRVRIAFESDFSSTISALERTDAEAAADIIAAEEAPKNVQKNENENENENEEKEGIRLAELASPSPSASPVRPSPRRSLAAASLSLFPMTAASPMRSGHQRLEDDELQMELP